MKHYCRYILTVLLLAGCASQDDVQAPAVDDMAVRFDVAVAEAAAETRAGYYALPIDLTVLKQEPGFGVYAYYTERQSWTDYSAAATGIYPNFMYDQLVKWDANSEVWTYNPVKYWPNGTGEANDFTGTGDNQERVSFFAYAPHAALNITDTSVKNDPTSDTSYGITHINGVELQQTALRALRGTGSEIYAPTISYKYDATKQVDLLWADPQLHNTKQRIPEKVPFTFHHALVCIDLYITRDVEDNMAGEGTGQLDEDTRLYVGKLSLASSGVPQTGTLNIGDGSWTGWTDSYSPSSPTFTYTVDQINDTIRGTDPDHADVEWELNQYSRYIGVTDYHHHFLSTGHQLLLPPGTITLTPTLTYSFVTRDDELLLNTGLTTTETVEGVTTTHYYSRILNENMAGNSATYTYEAGKRYKLLLRIGVRHVALAVVGVEDWDFPMRYTTTVEDYQPATPFEVTVDEP